MRGEDEQGDTDDAATGAPEEYTLGGDLAHNPTAEEAAAHEDEERQAQDVRGGGGREPAHARGEVDEVAVDAYLADLVGQEGQ